MSKLSNIVNGWKGYLKNEPLTKEQMKRAAICAQCPFATKSYLKDSNEQIDGIGCSKCGCPLPTKIRANGDSCPINKWGPIK